MDITNKYLTARGDVTGSYNTLSARLDAVDAAVATAGSTDATSFTAALGFGLGTDGTQDCWYSFTGTNLMWVSYQFTLGTSPDLDEPTITLPDGYQVVHAQVLSGASRDASPDGFTPLWAEAPAGGNTLSLWSTSGAVSSTSPITWAVGDVLHLSGGLIVEETTPL